MRTRSFAVMFALGTLLATTAGALAASRYVGTYTTLRPGADSTQAITLVLLPDGRAALTTSYPDLARPSGNRTSVIACVLSAPGRSVVYVPT